MSAEYIANIFFYTKNGTTIMIDAGYNYPRLKEKMAWLDLNPADIRHILITHQDTDHVGAVEKDSGEGRRWPLSRRSYKKLLLMRKEPEVGYLGTWIIMKNMALAFGRLY